MNIIRSIDLWTEQVDNHYECFNGAFLDGVTKSTMPFDCYKVVRNCNCIITADEKFRIRNKHNAIIFYKNNTPVRLIVANKNTDIDKCIKIALNQYFDNKKLIDIYEKQNIQTMYVDLKQESNINSFDGTNEIDVGSCDRWNLLVNMLKGSYTENDSNYGNYQSDKYEFLPNITIKYNLKIEEEQFIIEHKCAFINDIKTRIIPIQENSKLTK